MVVDDSAVIRGLIGRMLADDPNLSVVASVGNVQMAVQALAKTDVDVIIMDIEMPVMDGLTALPKLLEIDPEVRILMASTLTERNADVSIRAMTLGASDYVPKPTSTREVSGGDAFRRELLEKVRTLGGKPKRGLRRVPADAPRPVSAAPKPAVSIYPPGPVKLRSPGLLRPSILAVGSSTGGPQALFAFFKDVRPSINLPVVITQHMPPTFTTILAQHIEKTCQWPCAEAKDGDVPAPGRILLAPGDFHMLFDMKDGKPTARLTKDPPENFCRPAVDPMLRSLIQPYGGRVLVVILTGMGSDGAKGARAVVEAGGTVFAQDEASSVVWGMPGAVATAGLCSAVLPLNQMGGHVTQYLGGRA
ncbi:MAG: chemotaxis response regulator protein-glutamate methylesterase [Alphaproteobacteria bacterium]|nr:chemotaxis response regulator protein-glutamate methylesterase [Alphaproteobacteria bacterium]